MGCVFCATGQAGLARNLTAGEIVAQVLAAGAVAGAQRRRTNARIGSQTSRQSSVLSSIRRFVTLTNIVVMGMGEPMANYDRTWQALRTITDPDAFGLGARHITVSTVGLPPGHPAHGRGAVAGQPGGESARAERRAASQVGAHQPSLSRSAT